MSDMYEEVRAMRRASDVYDLDQVRVMREASKPLARHICHVSHPVFGRYPWLDEHDIYSDLLDDMLWDALTLLERHIEAGNGTTGEDDE
jgi:hypothetical protein